LPLTVLYIPLFLSVGSHGFGHRQSESLGVRLFMEKSFKLLARGFSKQN